MGPFGPAGPVATASATEIFRDKIVANATTSFFLLKFIISSFERKYIF
jgi:hypothetical protein